jgi:hypothetical protein
MSNRSPEYEYEDEHEDGREDEYGHEHEDGREHEDEYGQGALRGRAATASKGCWDWIGREGDRSYGRGRTKRYGPRRPSWTDRSSLPLPPPTGSSPSSQLLTGLA